MSDSAPDPQRGKKPDGKSAKSAKSGKTAKTAKTAVSVNGLPIPNIDDVKMDPVARAFARGDFAAARRALGAADTDTPTRAAVRAGLSLDPALPLTILALLALWAAVFFSTV